MFPQDLGGHCGLLALASHHREPDFVMNVVRDLVFLVLGLLLGMLLSSLAAWLLS